MQMFYHGKCIGLTVVMAEGPRPYLPGRLDMLRWAIIFLVIALVAALFGFGGIAGAATSIARILFFVFLVLFILSLLFGRRIFR